MKKLKQSELRQFNLFSLKTFFLAGCLAILTACGGGGGDGTPAPPGQKSEIVVTVSGLTSSAFILTSDDGVSGEGDTLDITANGVYRLKNLIGPGEDYNVQVEIQPEGQICTVSNGVGVGTGQKEINVAVTCSATGQTHEVMGELFGLKGGQLVLHNNGIDPLTLAANGKFKFPKRLARNSTYHVTIAAQPRGQQCTVTNARGDVTGDVVTVIVNCGLAQDAFAIGGLVSGLTGGTLVLSNNANGNTDTLNVTTDNAGSFTFGKSVPFNGSYNVQVVTNPQGLVCTANDNTGNNVDKNIDTVRIGCVPQSGGNTFLISGTLSGMDAGQTITLLNNGGNAEPLVANGKFKFSTKVGNGLKYSVSVDPENYPFLQQCRIENGGGTVNGADVVNVAVTCGTAPVTVTHSFPDTISDDNDLEYHPVKLIRSKNADGTDGQFYGVAATFDRIETKNPSNPWVEPDPNTSKSAYIFTMENNRVSDSDTWQWFMGSGRYFIQYPTFPTSLIQAKDGNILGTTFIAATAWNDSRYRDSIPFTGAIYKLNTLTTDFEQTACMFFVMNNCKFPGSTNAGPVGDLIQDPVTGSFYGVTFGDTLYKDSVGKTVQRQGGMLYKIASDGTTTMMYDFGSFNEQDGQPVPADAYPKGILPNGRLALAVDKNSGDTFLYGVTEKGGNGKGVIYRYNISQFFNGGQGGYEHLHSFDNVGVYPDPQPAASDVPFYDPYARPYSGLTHFENHLYGVSKYGGVFNTGRIYRRNMTTGVVETIYSFPGENTDASKNSMHPVGELIVLEDGNLYGVTQGSENKEKSANMGNIFRFNPKNCGPTSCPSLTVLYSFKGANAGADGNRPSTRLVDGGDGNLYGGTRWGGVDNVGAIYKFGRN